MYSDELKKKTKNFSPGERIKVVTDKKEIEGLLMPSPEITSSPEHLILKLDNGYNTGIHQDKIKKVKEPEEPEPKSIQQEYDQETDWHPHSKSECEKGNVKIINTGGTVASKVDYRTGAVNAALSAEEIASLVPEIRDFSCIDFKQVSETMSEDIGYKNWIEMAEEADKALKQNDGVVITHGTDTMHYSAAALSFFLQKGPVVFTGAQRSTDRGSSDSAMNLICSTIMAGTGMNETGICMHATPSDDYCHFIRGTKARKMHSSARNAFRPINDKPVAKIWPDGKIKGIQDPLNRSGELDTKFDPKVELVKAYPSSDPEVIDYHVDNGVNGLVIEGTGLGHVPTQARKSWIPSIKAAVNSGVPVVVCTQTLYGRVDENVYSNLRTLYYDANAISGKDMLPETAYVKLGWVLGHTKKMDKVQEMMHENYAGEFNDRLQLDDFLY